MQKHLSLVAAEGIKGLHKYTLYPELPYLHCKFNSMSHIIEPKIYLRLLCWSVLAGSLVLWICRCRFTARVLELAMDRNSLNTFTH